MQYPVKCLVKIRPDNYDISYIQPSREAIVALGYFYGCVEDNEEDCKTLINFLHCHEYVSKQEAQEALVASSQYKYFKEEIEDEVKIEVWQNGQDIEEAFRNTLIDIAYRHFAPEMLMLNSDNGYDIDIEPANIPLDL